MKALLAGCFLLFGVGVSAQSLVGTWVSPEPILVNLKFSLAFSEQEYVVDCTLGQTVGTWYATSDKIHFTPVKIGINSGDIGKSDVWDYRFLDNDTFMLSTTAVAVRMVRKK